MRKIFQFNSAVFSFYTLTAMLGLSNVLLYRGVLPGAPYGDLFQTDYYHFHWNYWWIRHALTHGENIYFTNYVMFPHESNLAYHSLTPIFFPIWAIIEPLAGTIVAMNVIILFCLALMGWSFFTLARQFGVRTGFALLGGLAFQFLPTHWNAIYLTNLNYLSMFWIPIHLMLWRQISLNIGQSNLRHALGWAVGLGLVFWGTVLTDPQLFIYDAPLLVAYGIATLLAKKNLRQMLQLALLGGVSLALMGVLGWVLGPLGYLMEFDRSSAALEDARGAFSIPFPDGFYHRLPEYWLTRTTLSLGLFPLAITALMTVLGLLLVFYKRQPVMKDTRWLWFLAALPPLILSAGSFIEWRGHEIKMPYFYVHEALGGLFRQPARFADVFVITIMIFCGLVAGQLVRSHRRLEWLMVMVGMILIFKDTAIFKSVPTQLPPTPYHFYEVMGDEEGKPYDDYVVLEVPTGSWSGEWGVGTQNFVTLQYHAITHHKRVINGFIARVPTWNFEYMRTSDPVMSWLGQRRYLEPDLVEPQLTQMIEEFPIGYIVVHQDMIGLSQPANQEIIGYFNQLDHLLCPPVVEGKAVAYRTRWHPDGCGTRTPPKIAPGVYEIDLGAEGDERFIGWGFHYAEAIFSVTIRWLGEYPQTDIYVDLPPDTYELAFEAQSFVEPRQVEVFADGQSLGTVTITPEALLTYRLLLPAELVGDGQHLQIRFDYDKWIVPQEAGMGGDLRKLSIMLTWIRFEQTQ